MTAPPVGERPSSPFTGGSDARHGELPDDDTGPRPERHRTVTVRTPGPPRRPSGVPKRPALSRTVTTAHRR
ncbi:hypothetical protein HX744_25070 [Pseudonocardia sp. ICBG1122]|nr:hypothetical protein [Pseudonocardia pini]